MVHVNYKEKTFICNECGESESYESKTRLFDKLAALHAFEQRHEKHITIPKKESK